MKPCTSHTFMELLKDVSPADLCPECKVIRTARSRHCAICNQCVERFDHHCPWVNNCVGINNHNGFLVFLLSIWVKIVFHSYFDTISLVKFIVTNESFDCENFQCVEFCIYGWCKNRYVHIAACGICILICIFYFLLSSVLLLTHCKNYMANRTTNERFTRRRTSGKRKGSNPNSGTNTETPTQTSSILTMSDFDDSSLLESSVVKEGNNEIIKKKTRKKKSKGCCVNCFRMATHT